MHFNSARKFDGVRTTYMVKSPVKSHPKQIKRDGGMGMATKNVKCNGVFLNMQLLAGYKMEVAKVSICAKSVMSR